MLPGTRREEQQILVAAGVTGAANDQQQAAPLGQQTKDNLQAAGIEPPAAEDGSEPAIPLSADTVYFSEDNVRDLESQGYDPYIATGRQKHNQTASRVPLPPTHRGRPKRGCRTSYGPRPGVLARAKRKHIAGPVFGPIKQARGFRQFLLRGLEKMHAEWKLVCLTHNLLKIWRDRIALT